MKFNEWTESTLGMLCDYVARGITPAYSESDGLIVLNQKCIRDYKVSLEQSRVHDINKKKLSDDKKLKRYDVLINSTGIGTAGRVAQWEMSIDATCDSHITIVRPNTNIIDACYFGYAVKAQQALIETFAEGSTGQTEMNKQRLCEEVIIQYPRSKNDQIKIANILSNIDGKMRINTLINENLFEQASALFSNAIQQSNSISYTELVSLADVKGGKRLPKGVNLITVPNQHPYIRVRDLNNTVFASLTNNYEYVDDETQKSISRYIVSTGDVLISIVGTIGLISIVDHTLDNANLTENCVKLTNLKKVKPEYLLLFLRSSQGEESISKGTVGAVQLKLPIKNIQSIVIPLPCDEELQQLDDILSTIFSQISVNIIEMKQLADMRDNLLPKLMSGKLDVSHLTI